jgi:hypothetical protein
MHALPDDDNADVFALFGARGEHMGMRYVWNARVGAYRYAVAWPKQERVRTLMRAPITREARAKLPRERVQDVALDVCEKCLLASDAHTETSEHAFRAQRMAIASDVRITRNAASAFVARYERERTFPRSWRAIARD